VWQSIQRTWRRLISVVGGQGMVNVLNVVAASIYSGAMAEVVHEFHRATIASACAHGAKPIYRPAS
jgi:hypothetical protein